MSHGSMPLTHSATSRELTATNTSSSGSTILPTSVSRFQGRETHAQRAAIARSLVDAAHDRVEAGHDGHRVRDQVAGHQVAHRLER